jgi:hypothetical protein
MANEKLLLTTLRQICKDNIKMDVLATCTALADWQTINKCN